MAQTGKCYGCGEVQTQTFLLGKNMTLFYCQAPHCSKQGILFCRSCLKKFGAKTDFLGDIHRTCPFCGIGKLKTR